MFFKTLVVCTAITVMSTINSSAQSTGVLKGRVTSSDNNEALTNAIVRLVNNPAKGTVTDPDGVYSLVLDTGYQKMTCEYIGLLPDTFIVHIIKDAITDKNVRLQASSEILNTVVISSGKFNQKLNELTVSMEVLKPAMIANKNTTSIETALEQVPGVTIIDNDPQIRGGSGFTFGVGSRVAILLDGLPMLSADAGRPEWNYMPVENISQVEVIKGTSSVLYGSSAINGVINLRTAYPTSEPKTVISYSMGGYSSPPQPAQNWYDGSIPGFMNLNFLHSQIINNNIDLVIGGNFNIDQGYIGPPPPQGYLPQYVKTAFLLPDTTTGLSNKDMLKERARLNFNLRYRSKKIPGLSYGINGNGMLNKTNMPLAWLNDSSGLYKAYPGAVLLENQIYYNLDPFIRYDAGNGVIHSLQTRIFHTDDQITGNRLTGDTLTSANRSPGDTVSNQSTRGTVCYAEYQLQKKYPDLDATFTGGVVANIATSHSQIYDSSGNPDNKTTNLAGYVQLDKKAWDILNLSGGVRYEYYQNNNQPGVSTPIYRAGASLQVLRGTWIRTSIGDGFRYPSITERYITDKAGLFGIFPNPGLQPETSKNFELGIKQGFKIGNCLGYFDLAGFQQNYHNTIEYLFGTWNPSIALVGFKFVNTGDSRVSGADMSMACSTPESNKNFGITALAGYTYIDPICLNPNYVYDTTKNLSGAAHANTFKSTSIDAAGDVLKYRFKNMVKLDVEARIHKFAAGISYRFYSKMQNIDTAFAEIESLTKTINGVYSQFQTINIVNYWETHKSFSVFDARISYKLSRKNKLSVICNNIFNVAYFLRPLKIEPPRTTAVQYVYTF
jgi:iron complex outermembrane receptor protein